ncbi:MAG: 2OG-Fe(II) oxygenase [Acidobacteria bacterium]|nr:2OG-Fe(II) oxygenase [Acidobacteriota bacterium]
MARGKLEQAIEELLLEVDRPGDFCAHGRLLAPMPVLEAKGAGALSFPVPEAQLQALIAVAERAPYGKGPATVVDPNVRDCRQIDAARIRLAGAGWHDTFGRILTAAADGLGCPLDRLDAHLYKLLIYEPGGFFVSHRDTEKADGMIATLSISLPVAGTGGEIVVRHRGRERAIDMTAAEPSELAFAAFYADCEHEVRPVTEGYRLSLVFSLCLRAGDNDTPRTAPDYDQQVDRLARRLAAWRRGPDAVEKLAWVLEHEYSEAGLSFDALKNRDAALARILAAAAGRADCALHAAILHLEEWGAASYSGGFADWGWDGSEDDDVEMEEVEDYRQWLDGWVGPDGGRPPFGEIDLSPEERLPHGALDGIEPDEQHVEGATGNEGATVERTYRRAALVLWPESRTLTVVADSGIDTAVAWVAEQLDWSGEGTDERIRTLTAQLIDIWPAGRDDFDESDATGRARMLRLLCDTRDEGGAARFLRDVIVACYDGSENEALAAVLDMLGPPGGEYFLLDMIGAHLRRRPAAMLGLLWRLDEAHRAAADPDWDVVLRETVRAALGALPAALPPEPEEDVPWTASRRPTRFSETAVYHLFALAWRLGLPDAAAAAAGAVAAEPRVVAPDRALPAVLAKLHAEEGAAGSAAFARLWRHAADSLLARSAEPPTPPGDWTIAANAGCRCEHCGRLRDFCKDPTTRTARFPLRKDLRAHLHQIIDGQQLDIEHVTERRGRPFTLVCTKTRASHKRRRAEYAEDVSWMQGLIEAAPDGEQAADRAPQLAALRSAVTASETA